MFPHATCLCAKTAQSGEKNVDTDIDRTQNQSNIKSLNQIDQDQNKENPWIIRRRADFVEINVLSSSQVSVILQQTRHRLCNQQVRHSHLLRISFNVVQFCHPFLTISPFPTVSLYPFA